MYYEVLLKVINPGIELSLESSCAHFPSQINIDVPSRLFLSSFLVNWSVSNDNFLT